MLRKKREGFKKNLINYKKFQKKNYVGVSLPVKHAQRVTFLQQFLNISLMQGSSNNQDNIVYHVTISGWKDWNVTLFLSNNLPQTKL